MISVVDVDHTTQVSVNFGSSLGLFHCIMKILTTHSLLIIWFLFLIFKPSLHGASVICAIGHYALTRGTSNADPQLLGAALLGELSLPYTLIFLMPTNNRLMDMEGCKRKGIDNLCYEPLR